jgi:hypothetical protein
MDKVIADLLCILLQGWWSIKCRYNYRSLVVVDFYSYKFCVVTLEKFSCTILSKLLRPILSLAQKLGSTIRSILLRSYQQISIIYSEMTEKDPKEAVSSLRSTIVSFAQNFSIISVSVVSTRLCRRTFLFLMLWQLMFKMRKVSLLARVVSLVLCCFGDDDASGLLMVDMLLSKLDKLSILTLLSLNSTQRSV